VVFLRVLLSALVGWLEREQQEALAYLIEENRILRGQLRGRRLRLSDDDRRRSQRVDEAILGQYLSGTNTRCIKRTLAPLLRGGRPLSKGSVSRLVGRLADDFETWRRRDLAGDQIPSLLLSDRLVEELFEP
jgi:hypothetical protein